MPDTGNLKQRFILVLAFSEVSVHDSLACRQKITLGGHGRGKLLTSQLQASRANWRSVREKEARK